jgi:hypothetical protein
MDRDPLMKLLWVTLLSFFSAFAKELNDKAKDPSEKLIMFLSEIFLNGVCGMIVGAITLSFTDNVYFVSACSAIGGLFGMNAVKIVLKYLLAYISVLKNIKVDDIDIDGDKEDKKNKQ